MSHRRACTTFAAPCHCRVCVLRDPAVLATPGSQGWCPRAAFISSVATFGATITTSATPPSMEAPKASGGARRKRVGRTCQKREGTRRGLSSRARSGDEDADPENLASRAEFQRTTASISRGPGIRTRLDTLDSRRRWRAAARAPRGLPEGGAGGPAGRSTGLHEGARQTSI